MPAVRAVGFAHNPTSTNMFVQESLVTSLWWLKVHGAAERIVGFHETDTSEPKKKGETNLLSENQDKEQRTSATAKLCPLRQNR
jgi:hypothetical protein